MTYKFILAAYENDEPGLLNGIKTIFNCQDVETDIDIINSTARIAIANPQRFHWLDDEGLDRVERALKASDI